MEQEAVAWPGLTAERGERAARRVIRPGPKHPEWPALQSGELSALSVALLLKLGTENRQIVTDCCIMLNHD